VLRRHLGRVLSVTALALVAVGLLVAVGAEDGGTDGPTQAAAPPATAPAEPDPYPLASGQTPANVRLLVFERAYSECASHELAQLAAKYKSADTSKQGVAVVVGRAWASYFKAGRDAAREGRAGCLQAAESR
jgi:hypothetical protein